MSTIQKLGFSYLPFIYFGVIFMSNFVLKLTKNCLTKLQTYETDNNFALHLHSISRWASKAFSMHTILLLLLLLHIHISVEGKWIKTGNIQPKFNHSPPPTILSFSLSLSCTLEKIYYPPPRTVVIVVYIVHFYSFLSLSLFPSLLTVLATCKYSQY